MNPMFSDNAAYAVQRLQQLGWSPAAAVGMVGNLVQESGPNLNPTATHDGGTGFGIAGFRDPRPGEGRWTNLRSFAGQQGLNYRDLDTQLRFIDHELRTSESGVGNRLRNARDASDAARISIDFFRPEGWTRNNPTGGHGWNNRLQNAQTLARGVGAMPGNLQPPPSTGGTAAYASMPAAGASNASGRAPGSGSPLESMFSAIAQPRDLSAINANDYAGGDWIPPDIGAELARRQMAGGAPSAPLPVARPEGVGAPGPAPTALEQAGIMPRSPDAGLGVFEMPTGGLTALEQAPASYANPGMPNAGGVMPLGPAGPAAFGMMPPPSPGAAPGMADDRIEGAPLDLGGLANMFAGVGQPAPQQAGPDMVSLAALMQPQQPQMMAQGPTALDAAAMLQEREREMTRRAPGRRGRPNRAAPMGLTGMFA